MRVLDLFSGIGGFSLGLEMASPEFETVAFCEQDEFCQKVLKKHWPEVPIFNDVRTLDATGLGRIDLICGGYPCQPFSVAGKRRGEEDDRHLWPSMFALVKELRPDWVIGENVAGHISMGLDEVLSDLEGEGYTARAFVIPACAVDAPHRRDRVWVISHRNNLLHKGELDNGRDSSSARGGESGNSRKGETSNRQRLWAQSSASSETLAGTQVLQRNGEQYHGASIEGQVSKLGERGCPGDVSHADSINAQGELGGNADQKRRAQQGERPTGSQSSGDGRFWPPEPGVGRVAPRLPNHVDRLSALGNAVVPQVVQRIGEAIIQAEKETE